MRSKLLFLSVLFMTGSFLYYYFSFPKELKKVPLSEKKGLVLDIKNINLKNINPVNTSIEKYLNNDYIIAYRIREKNSDFIGIAILDENFKVKKEPIKIDVKSTKAEDPRIFKYKNEYFLLYNDILPIKHYCRVMKIAKLTKDFKVEYQTSLDLHIKPVEKNWVPFVKDNKLLLSYNLMPHKVMELEDTRKNSLIHYTYENNPCFSRFFWDWGEPRGGTPAKLVNGEYLAFFHSCFGKKKKWYVMGAYTYQANPPYKVTKVSKYPILFGKIKNTRIVFPCGFIEQKENNKNLIYVSYGENDSISKIVVIDKEKLYESMQKVY